MMPTDLKPSAQRVLQYMIDFGSITGHQAITDLGMTELRSRISEISRAGFAIKKEWQNSKNKFGETVSFVRYSLNQEGDDE
ncbi:MAG: hypothetical protein IIZ83_08795 [Oscillospiraceae bacterium]|nr:hypothetical protein [Oscillospiraceae bacterium]